MPNILKHFFGSVNDYVFPEAEDLSVEDPPVQETEPEPEAEAPPAEEDAAPEEATEEDPGAGAAALFSYARVQADEIVAQARQEGEALLEQYRKQAEQEAQEARETARQEGYRQGYADGMKKAQVEGAAAMESQRREEQQEVRTFLEEATRAREDLMEKVQGELCDLSIAVAEKIIHISLKSSREVIVRMIQMATERLKRREWVRIYVGGCDAKELAQIAPELTASLTGLSDHIKLIPLADDESGTCIIEMPDEIIDASVSTQIHNLRDILHGG